MLFDDGKQGRLQGLKTLADTYRTNPQYGSLIREFERVLELIRGIETGGGTYSGIDVLTAVEAELQKAGQAVRVRELARTLDTAGVQAPATRNPKQKERVRRPLSNAERLEKQLLQSVNHGRLLGYKKVENGRTITYVGLSDWPVPVGAQLIGRKRSDQQLQ